MAYEKAKTQAEYLKEAAAVVRKESDNVMNCRENITRAWQGDNAGAFIGRMNVLSDDLSRIAKQLEEAAEVILK